MAYSKGLEFAGETCYIVSALFEVGFSSQNLCLLHQGISQQQREYFELSNDDERQCSVCKTCCFLSAVRCPCTPNQLVCPHHVQDLCACPMDKKVLRYRYTLEELRGMMQSLQERSQAYQNWLQQVESLLDGQHADKPGQRKDCGRPRRNVLVSFVYISSPRLEKWMVAYTTNLFDFLLCVWSLNN